MNVLVASLGQQRYLDIYNYMEFFQSAYLLCCQLYKTRPLSARHLQFLYSLCLEPLAILPQRQRSNGDSYGTEKRIGQVGIGSRTSRTNQSILKTSNTRLLWETSIIGLLLSKRQKRLKASRCFSTLLVF